MNWTTRVTELLGIEKPIFQGAMAHIANAELAAAVSNAGGLGIVACGGKSVDWIREEIERTRALTDKPFGANVMMAAPNVAEVAELLAGLRVPVITTGAGSPVAYMDLWKSAGIKVIPVIATSAQAKRMERCGADAVVAEGCESGGHIGELTTMALTPAVCDAVDIPVIAAGGIADGRGLVAAFALGAEGVQLGTRFLTATECCISQAYKDKVIQAKDSDTIVTGRIKGRPARQLKNAWSRQVRADELAGLAGEVKAETEAAGEATGKSAAAKDVAVNTAVLSGSLLRAVNGDVETGSLMAGQVACLVHDEKTCQQIIDDLFAEADSLLRTPFFCG